MNAYLPFRYDFSKSQKLKACDLFISLYITMQMISTIKGIRGVSSVLDSISRAVK